MPNRKQIFKIISRACNVCGESDYSLLDVHRIIPGSAGGKYIEGNMVCLCCKCHRKVHAGTIEIKGRYFSTKGYVLHYFDEGKEYISPC